MNVETEFPPIEEEVLIPPPAPPSRSKLRIIIALGLIVVCVAAALAVARMEMPPARPAADRSKSATSTALAKLKIQTDALHAADVAGAEALVGRITEFRVISSGAPADVDMLLNQIVDKLFDGLAADGGPLSQRAVDSGTLALTATTNPALRIIIALRVADFQRRNGEGVERQYMLLGQIDNDIDTLAPRPRTKALTALAMILAHMQGDASSDVAIRLARSIKVPAARTTTLHRVARVVIDKRFSEGGIKRRHLTGHAFDDALFGWAWQAARLKQFRPAMTYAIAIDPALGSRRDHLLAFIADNMANDEDIEFAGIPLEAMTGSAARDPALLDLVSTALAQHMLHEAVAAQREIASADMATMARVLIVRELASNRLLQQVESYRKNLLPAISVMSGPIREVAAARMVEASVKLDDIDGALSAFELIAKNSALRSRAAREIVTARLRLGADAEKLTDFIDDAVGPERGDIIGLLAAAAASDGDIAGAETMVDQYSDASTLARAVARVAATNRMPQGWLEQQALRIAAIPTQQLNDRELAIGMIECALNQTDAARHRIVFVTDAEDRLALVSALSTHLVADRNLPGARALSLYLAATDEDGLDALAAARARALLQKRDIHAATAEARTMVNYLDRLRTFRALARMQARYLDPTGALSSTTTADTPDQDLDVPTPLLRRTHYDIFDLEDRRLGERLPAIPDVEPYKSEMVRRMVPPIGNAVVRVAPLANNGFNKKFLTSTALFDEQEIGGPTIVMKSQGTRYPIYVHVSGGVIDLPTLHTRLAAQGWGDALHRQGRVYTLRVPLLIGSDATLVLSGTDVGQLRLSAERSTYIVNAGTMFAVGVQIVGWNEETNSPAHGTIETINSVRPFYAAWSNSRTYATESRFLSLGYSAGKAYGFSLSSGPTWLNGFVQELADPTGLVIENSFENMLYGFYSYEASKVAVVGNEYRDNIIYGIDPHDRSSELLFAFNTAYGSQKKHGIIGSRHVENSWFLGNVSFDNHGAGLMMDRYSGRNFIAANTTFNNHADGLAVYESPCNLVTHNVFFGNHGSGVRIRNSWDVGIYSNNLRNNHGHGVEGYTVEFVTAPGAKPRNLVLDPYETVLSASIVGNTVANNRSGSIRMSSLRAVALRDNRLVGNSARAYLGDLRIVEQDVARMQSSGLIVGGGCPSPRVAYSCPFVTSGFISNEVPAVPKAMHALASCPMKTVINEVTRKGAPRRNVTPITETRDEEDLLSAPQENPISSPLAGTF